MKEAKTAHAEPAGRRAFRIAEVAKLVGLGEASVRRLVREGELPARIVSKRTIVVLEADLARWLASAPSAARPRAQET